MVRYHYALVDDLISREEFDRRIESKIEECGNLADEVAAALLVVRDLGRSHVKVRELRGKSSLFCFYAKIIAFSGVKEFDRTEGEKGLVARLTVADETGQVDLVFWDEQAAALEDTFEIGDVVEVIGRHGKSGREIMPLNLRRTNCDIDCEMTPKIRKEPERKDLTLLIISLSDPRPFTRRDATAGEMVSGIVGDQSGTAKLLCWDAPLLSGFLPGTALDVSGAIEKEGDYGGREIVFDENTVLLPAERDPDIPITRITDIMPDQTISVSGIITQVNPARPFTRRDGSQSHVRNIRIQDETAELHLVLWDDEATRPLLTGEKVQIYHAPARIGRTGDIEVSIGRGSCLKIMPDPDGEQICIRGTILSLPDGTYIDDGTISYLVETKLVHGTEAEIRGLAGGQRLFSESEQTLDINPDDVKKRLDALIQTL